MERGGAIISPWNEQLAQPSARMRQKYNFQWKLTPKSHSQKNGEILRLSAYPWATDFFHWKLYFCLILTEGRANCSFQYLREAGVKIRFKLGFVHHCLLPTQLYLRILPGEGLLRLIFFPEKGLKFFFLEFLQAISQVITGPSLLHRKSWAPKTCPCTEKKSFSRTGVIQTNWFN